MFFDHLESRKNVLCAPEHLHRSKSAKIGTERAILRFSKITKFCYSVIHCLPCLFIEKQWIKHFSNLFFRKLLVIGTESLFGTQNRFWPLVSVLRSVLIVTIPEYASLPVSRFDNTFLLLSSKPHQNFTRRKISTDLPNFVSKKS